MKVLVAGANGQIGRHIVHKLHQHSDHTVRAMVRKEEHAEELKKQGIDAVIANLEGHKKSLIKAAGGCDAVIFTAGSGGDTGADKTLLVDLDGAAKMIEAAEESGAERFIMISSMRADSREQWIDSFRHYFAAKYYADKILEFSRLNYTIIRPGGLLNEEGTGNVQLAEHIDDSGYIPREDVAAVTVAALSAKSTYQKSFDLVSGDVPIMDLFTD